ncbi:MAG: carbon monoxide dehydrogenase [Bacillota bacterium]|nr:carbon monoxide dehydrogenase [Bacillota bacterium]
MKIAVGGKGGVGKTNVAAGLVRLLAEQGPVWAVDADPDACLACALGVPQREASTLKPFSEMRSVIRERLGGEGGYTILNPRVDDLLEKHALVRGNIRMIRMGALKKGGAGCYCRENAFLNALISSVLLDKEEMAVIDLAAGIEQLSRGSARGVDRLVVVCDPTRAAVSTARNITAMARDLGIEEVGWVANRVRGGAERDFIARSAAGIPVWGYLGWHEEFLGETGREDCITEMPHAFLSGLREVVGRLIRR